MPSNKSEEYLSLSKCVSKEQYNKVHLKECHLKHNLICFFFFDDSEDSLVDSSASEKIIIV